MQSEVFFGKEKVLDLKISLVSFQIGCNVNISGMSFISIADRLLLNAISFCSLSNIPDSNRAAKGLFRVLLFNLKISCKFWWFLWIILKSCDGII